MSKCRLCGHYIDHDRRDWDYANHIEGIEDSEALRDVPVARDEREAGRDVRTRPASHEQQ